MIIDSLIPLIVEIKSIQPDARNARKHPQRNLDTIKKSLQTYGQRKPIVVNSKTGVIEAGNGLYSAAVELGWTEIAAVMVEDDHATATGYALMDNKSADLSEWDLPTLKDILEELDSGAFDMDNTGFAIDEIEVLMTQFNPVDISDQPRLDEKKKVKCPDCGCEFTP